MLYNWLYTTSNDNEYILILIIVALFLIIVNFKLWKRKKDLFYDIPQNTQDTTPTTQDTTPTTQDTTPTTQDTTPTTQDTITSQQTQVFLDGDQETVDNTMPLPTFTNDIIQSPSTLYNNGNPKSNIQANNYSTIGDYATLDSLGKMLTDKIGGIKSSLGYTILDEQLGTFNSYSNQNKSNQNYENQTNASPNTYDNTADYKTGMNPSTVDGTSKSKISTNGVGFSGKFMQDNRPIFMQKDFAGVANIFAPNIIVANAPLNSDGTPDIKFEM